MKASELLLAVLQRHGIRMDAAALQQELEAVRQEQRVRRRQRPLAEYVAPANTTAVVLEVTPDQFVELMVKAGDMIPLKVSFKGTKPKKNKSQSQSQSQNQNQS